VFKIINYNKIRELAKQQGISLASINSRLGKSRYYLNAAIHDNIKLQPDQIAIIAEALHTTPEYLTDQTDQKEKEPINDRLFEEYYALFSKLTPEQQARELAYIRSLISQDK
jgi:transcriptional regulator with XRE-family HTH domain